MPYANPEIKPFFSIVIPTRDRAFLLKDLIDSVVSQDFDGFEIIVADNSKELLSQDLLGSYKNEARLHNVKTGNLNMADNWETAINSASGKYLLLFSDKMILKQGSLKFLKEYITQNKPDCITWNIDSYYDYENVYFDKSTILEDQIISSDDLFRDILKADMMSFERSAFHCNSAVSFDVINKIKAKTGRVCMQLNPDYTMSYQILMNINNINSLSKSLTVLRHKSYEESYGNGNSFMKKTSQAALFMNDNKDWVRRIGEISDVPIEGNNFALDVILKDLYEVLSLYNKNPDELVPRNIRTSCYYFYTLNEIYWRISMGVDMKEELRLWKSTLKQESVEIRSSAGKLIKLLVFKKHKILLIQFCKRSFLISPFINLIRSIIHANKGKRYNSITELFHNLYVE